MTREQYLRMDKKVVMIIGCTLLFIMFSLLEVIAIGNARTGTYVQLVIAALLLIFSIIGFVIFKGRRVCGSILTGTGALIFLVVMSLGNSNMSYTYAFPVLIASMMYLNARFAIVGSTIIVIANIVRTIREVSNGEFVLENVLNRWALTLLVCVTSYVVMRLIQKQNEENVNNVKMAASEQKDIAEKMQMTAGDIEKNFQTANAMLIRLKESVDANNYTMHNIAESTESTAQSIQEQAQMCANIQEGSDIAERETAKVAEVSLSTSINVAEGGRFS